MYPVFSDEAKPIIDFIEANSGLCHGGLVTNVPAANQFTIPTLAGLGNARFADVVAPFQAFVAWDAGALGALPQGQMNPVTVYDSVTGTFTALGFGGGGIAAGDWVLLVHPSIAGVLLAIAAVEAKLDLPIPDAGLNTRIAEVVGNLASTAIYTKTITADSIRYLKGLLDAGIAISGAVNDAGAAITDFNTNLAEATNNHYNNMLMLMLTGANAGQSHHIQTYLGAGGNCAFVAGDQWTDLPVTGNIFVILPASMGHLIAMLTVPAVDVGTNVLERDVIGNKADAAVLVVSAVNSIVAYVKGIIQLVNAIFTLKVHTVEIYPVAEDATTTELADSGAVPPYYPAAPDVTLLNAAPGHAAWSEDINFEQDGTINLISIYLELEWETMFVDNGGAGVNSISKMQISRDAGANWVDVTDDFTNPALVATNHIRQGAGLWITTVVAGANKLMLRLVHWTDDAGGTDASSAQVRANTKMVITYRKS